MSYSRVRWLVGGLVVVVSLVCAYAVESLTIVDVIPNSLSGETDDNSEPNIGVNPVNPRQAVISSFGHITSFSPFTISNPYFATNNGGTTWSDGRHQVWRPRDRGEWRSRYHGPDSVYYECE